MICHPEPSRSNKVGMAQPRDLPFLLLQWLVFLIRHSPPMREHNYYVYIVASRSRVLYIGITNNLQRRVWEHRTGKYPGFTSKYRCHRLVWFEPYITVTLAIAREKQLKDWARAKKITLIERENPAWSDLSLEWQETAGPSTGEFRLTR